MSEGVANKSSEVLGLGDQALELQCKRNGLLRSKSTANQHRQMPPLAFSALVLVVMRILGGVPSKYDASSSVASSCATCISDKYTYLFMRHVGNAHFLIVGVDNSLVKLALALNGLRCALDNLGRSISPAITRILTNEKIYVDEELR